MPAKQRAYAAVQTEIARDLPYIPVVLNASQAFFNVKKFSGWPTESDLYANPLPYLSVASAVVLRQLSQRQESNYAPEPREILIRQLKAI